MYKSTQNTERKQSLTKNEVFNNIIKTKEVLTIKWKEIDRQETLKE